MKYSHQSKHRKKCLHDPQHRAQIGYRLRLARCSMGWTVEAAAKYFQVTQRTWNNWESGAHRIPFAVYKLCRVLARMELPGDAWAGWSLQGSALITPEGRRIEPHDSSWWSLMVRNSQSFSAAYNEARRLRALLDGQEKQAQASAVGAAATAGLVSYKTNGHAQSEPCHQNDVIMESWPILSDSPTPSTPQHAPKPTISASPLTPSFASPWMPTCGFQLTLQRPQPGPHRSPMNHPKQEALQSPQSSAEPKSKPSTSAKKPKENASLNSRATAKAMPAARSAKLESAPKGAAWQK